ncbi:MAG: hypothetical protein AB7I79_05640 [Rhizobiaceae bacterium]
MNRLVPLGAAASLVAASMAADAACPIELAVYGDPASGIELDFTPGSGNALVTNGYRMLLGGDVVLTGFVMRSEDVERSWGTVMHDCPEGDVTGDEIAACTVWEGIVYAVSEKGEVTLLPPEDNPAPPTLLFAGLGPFVRQSEAYARSGLAAAPSDVFALKGCQE